MYTIVLHGNGEKNFSVLIGFELLLPLSRYVGFDPYGFLVSDDTSHIVFSTYL